MAWWWKRFKVLCVVLASEGIGAGIIINDELFQGAYDYVGEIVYTLFYDLAKFRYLEDIAGVDILIKYARSQGLDIENIKDILILLQKNDRLTESIVKQIATRICFAEIDIIHNFRAGSSIYWWQDSRARR